MQPNWLCPQYTAFEQQSEQATLRSLYASSITLGALMYALRGSVSVVFVALLRTKTPAVCLRWFATNVWGWKAQRPVVPR